MNITGDKGVSAAKVQAAAAINTSAETAHRAAAGGVSPSIVMAKEDEAKTFLAAYPNQNGAPQTVSAVTYPFIAAETGKTAANPWMTATAFINAAKHWRAAAARVEGARATAHAAVSAAKDPNEIAKIQRVTWPTT